MTSHLPLPIRSGSEKSLIAGMHEASSFGYFEVLMWLQYSGILTGFDIVQLSRSKALSQTIPLAFFESGDWKKIKFEDYKGGESFEKGKDPPRDNGTNSEE